MKVLVSRGFGAGWSSWNVDELATDKKLIELFEKLTPNNKKILMEYIKKFSDIKTILKNIEEGNAKKFLQRINKIDSDAYIGGFNGLEIVNVEKNTIFKIVNYDGDEDIEVIGYLESGIFISQD